ncbi:hypothetical protein ACGTJS_01465 [Faucicola mancuniensis]|uniref:hypothetical protein n=1 Tax=Faucicola mancuniensis TaxID=1309795 RepID=UPI0039776BA7
MPNDQSLQQIVRSRPKMLYDFFMIAFISLDLLILTIDSLLMSNFMAYVGNWAGFGGWLLHYQSNIHPQLKFVGGLFTMFLVAELIVRWGIAIVNKSHYRWFFFPFVHWYEVLGCFPQLRALRLLRVVVIGYRLHKIGKQVLPKSWLKTLKFYYHVVLEEISDRVIIMAIDNIRAELANTDGHLVQNIIDRHRDEIETVIIELLQQEVPPLLQATPNAPPAFIVPIAEQVSVAVEQAITQTPELHRLLRLIPIAGGMIEDQIVNISQKIGKNITLNTAQHLTQTDNLNQIYHEIAKGVSQVDTTSETLEKLVSSIIHESLTAIAEQVKIQQWKAHANSPDLVH